ncbi:YciI family protein [Devosia sp. XK-2]|uniref:YciI family protein n=1 Tax=Devosia sp. XK-2 TaxID=3126689 RepID=UPI0030CAE93E
MQFMALVYIDPGAMDGMSAEDFRRLDDATIEHDHKLRASGHLIFASPLAAPETGRVLRFANGELITLDGPYAESKEVVAGFLLLEVESVEALTPLFEDDPILKYGRMEIRPLVQHTHSQTGQGRPEFAHSTD